MSETTESKVCTECGRELPATGEFFRVRKGRLGGRCKECVASYSKQWRAANRARLLEYGRQYYHQHNGDDQRAAARARSQAWREANPERSTAQQREWYLRNKERNNARAQEWYKANTDLAKAQAKARRQRHPERSAGYQRSYRSRHPEMQRAEKANAKARKLGIEGKLSGADIKAQYEAQEGRCFYCGAELDDHWHVDHFVPFSLSGSNTKDNIRVACGFCNDSKGTRHPDEFLRALAGDTRR